MFWSTEKGFGQKELRSGRQFVVPFGFGNAVLPDLIEQGFVTDLQDRGSLFAVPVGLFQSLGNGLRFGFIFGGTCQRFQAARLHSPRRGIALHSAGAVVSGQQFGDG